MYEKNGARFDKVVDMEPNHLTKYGTKLLEVRLMNYGFAMLFKLVDGSLR